MKGCKFLFNHLKSLASLEDTQWFPLVKAVEIAFVSGFGEDFMDEFRRKHHEQMYQKARELSEGIVLPPEEWRKAA